MTGCIAQRNGIYYVRLTYYDQNHKRKDKWVTTGLSGKGAKQKEALEKFDDCHSELTDINERQLFVYAFRLGMRIAIEVL